MTVFREGELEFRFPSSVGAIRFDGPGHGLSHCLKAVDFILEFPGFDLLVEVKDADQRGVKPKQLSAFLADLQRERIIGQLVGKYRDSFLYRWAED